VALAAAVGWAAAASSVRTFTHPAEVLTFLPGLAVLVVTVRPSFWPVSRRGTTTHAIRDPAPPPASATRRGALLWVLAGGALVGWELASLFSQPRSAHPTLSSITDSLVSTHPSRFAGYLSWLALGWLLVRDRDPRRG
jgi:hypothetical protein